MIYKWYKIFSFWIFVASLLYPLHKFSTYPLILVSLPAGFTFRKSFFLPALTGFLIHIIPFYIVPFDVSPMTILYNLVFVLLYLIYIACCGQTVTEIYTYINMGKYNSNFEWLYERFLS